MNARRPGPVRTARRWVVDTALMRPDPWPEIALAGAGTLLGLVIAAWLFGSFPGVGVQGPVQVVPVAQDAATDGETEGRGRAERTSEAKTDKTEQADAGAAGSSDVPPVPTALEGIAAAMTSGQTLVPPAEGWPRQGIERVWLDATACSPTKNRSRGERLALIHYVRSEAGLCQGMDLRLILAPMTPVIGPVASMVFSILILAGLAFGVFVTARFLRRVRLAYRRLYVSEHRADHLEDGG